MLEILIPKLLSHYPAHSIILYGSRAGLDYRNDSDYDFLFIKEKGNRVREVFELDGLNIDLIVDSEEIQNRPLDTLYLWQSKILIDEKGFAKNLVEKNSSLLKTTPSPLPENRIKQRKKQIQDQLIYIQMDNVLGHFRIHDLLAKLFELYFTLKCQWNLGDKYGFQWMKKNDPKAYSLFEIALKPNASYEDITNLVNFIQQL